MPSTRFLNLPAEKRERILNAAMHEFSRVPYDEVSINQIIAIAGIPRGSFYQYFEGKKDLLEYIMQDFGKQMETTVRASLESSGGDVFAVFVDVLRQVVHLGEDYHNMSFFRNIFSCSRHSDLFSFSFSNFHIDELLQVYGPLVDLGCLRDAGRAGQRDTLEILVTLLRAAIGQVCIRDEAPDVVLQSFERKLKLVRLGLGREGGAV